MAKKVLVFLLLGIFLINFASAWDFDNTYEYFEEVNTAVIHNCDIWIGWCWSEGEVLSTLTLTSPNNKIVHRGKDILVGEFNLTTTGDFEDIFSDIYLTDLKNGNSISRGKQFKYKKYKNVSVDDYETVCNNVTDGNGTRQECTQEEVGSHWEMQVDWIPINNPTVTFYSNQTYEIGVFVDVEEGDRGDWIPSLMGIQIEEWAQWTESLNVDLVAYYTLNDDLATTKVIDATGAINGTATVNTDVLSITGHIGDAFSMQTTTHTADLISPSDLTEDFTISAWIRVQDNTDLHIISSSWSSALEQTLFWKNGNNLMLYVDVGTSLANTEDTLTTLNEWVHVAAVYNGSFIRTYINGVGGTAVALTGTLQQGGETYKLASYSPNPSANEDIDIDELAYWSRALSQSEILNNLYNGGAGNTWTDNFGVAPKITLTSPANNSNLTSSTVDFITTVTDDELVVNVSLILDGVINQTNTSGYNGTYTFTQSVAEGSHNWSILAYDNDSLSNQSETRVFNYTQPPINITLNEPTDAFVSQIPLVNMSCSASDALGVEQLNLTINGVVNETLLNSTQAQNLTIHKSIAFAEGIYIWGCQAYNSMDNASSANRTLNVSYSNPVVTLILPIDDFNVSTNSLDFIFNVTDVNGVSNVTLYIDDILSEVNTSGVSGQYSITKTFAEGLHNWSVSSTSILGKTTLSETRDFNATFSSPNITLLTPSDNSNTTDTSVNFTFTATDFNGISNVTLFINGVLNETNTSGVNGSYLFQRTLSEGIYNWSVNATSTFGKEAASSINNFIVHLTSPNATILAPSGSLGYFLLGENETLSYNFSELGQNISEHLEECWYVYPDIECYQESANTGNQTGTDGNCGLNYTGNYNYTISPEFTYINYTKPDNFTSAKWLVKIGPTLAEPINLTIPNECFNADSDNLMLGFNQSSIIFSVWVNGVCYNGTSWINITPIPPTGPIGGNLGTISTFDRINDGDWDTEVHLVNSVGFEGWWKLTDNLQFDFLNIYEEAIYWGHNIDLNCTENETTFEYIEEQNTISIFARDTFGFIANDTSTWTYKLLEFNTTYNAATVEGSTETFTLTMNSGGTVISSSLIYNGTAYPTSILSPGGGQYVISSTISIPDFPTDSNATFYFDVTFLDSTTISSSTNTQFVSVLILGNCSAYSNLLLNVSLFDEKTLVPLVGTVESDLVILDSLGTSSLSNSSATFYNQSNFEICSNVNITAGDFLYNLELRYYVDPNNDSNFLYVPEFYHIQKASVNDFPQAIDLYDLNANDSTEFVITYQNDNFIFVEDAIIQLQRKYIGEGIYRVVEAPITSDGGKAIVHVDLNTNKYRASVVKDGVVLDIFEGIVFSCENELSGECEEKLEGNVDSNNDVPLTDLTDFSYSVTPSSANNTITVVFAIPSNVPAVVNVLLDQKDMFGNETSCNTTVIASAGSIICSYNDTIEKSVLELTITKDDLNQAILGYVNDPSLDMDGMNFFIVFLFMISLVGMAIASPEWMVIISVMVLMISGMLLLVNGMSLVMGLGAIAWLIIAVAIIILKMSKQEDR